MLPPFNGVDNYIDTGHSYERVFRDSFTVCLWIKPYNGHPENQMEVIMGTKNGKRSNGFTFQVKENGDIQAVYETANRTVFIRSVEPVFRAGKNNWTHLAFVANQSRSIASLYINGELNRTLDCSALDFSRYDCPYNVYLGCRNSGGVATHFFQGELSDVRIINKALSSYRIKQIFIN